MVTQLVFETHSWSKDNELGIASGWRHSQLSERGRTLARELGKRRRHDGIEAVFTSEPILYDWRLRECDYGDLNGMPASELHRNRRRYLDEPYPGGESWRQAVQRVGCFLRDLPLRWAGSRVLVIGHVATRWAFDHFVDGIAIEDLMEADFNWREGWEYRMQ